MPISEKDIFASLMQDPNHAYNPIEKVWAEAQQRARQFRNNEKALALAFDESPALEKLLEFMQKAEETDDEFTIGLKNNLDNFQTFRDRAFELNRLYRAWPVRKWSGLPDAFDSGERIKTGLSTATSLGAFNSFLTIAEPGFEMVVSLVGELISNPSLTFAQAIKDKGADLVNFVSDHLNRNGGIKAINTIGLNNYEEHEFIKENNTAARIALNEPEPTGDEEPEPTEEEAAPTPTNYDELSNEDKGLFHAQMEIADSRGAADALGQPYIGDVENTDEFKNKIRHFIEGLALPTNQRRTEFWGRYEPLEAPAPRQFTGEEDESDDADGNVPTTNYNSDENDASDAQAEMENREQQERAQRIEAGTAPIPGSPDEQNAFDEYFDSLNLSDDIKTNLEAAQEQWYERQENRTAPYVPPSDMIQMLRDEGVDVSDNWWAQEPVTNDATREEAPEPDPEPEATSLEGEGRNAYKQFQPRNLSQGADQGEPLIPTLGEDKTPYNPFAEDVDWNDNTQRNEAISKLIGEYVRLHEGDASASHLGHTQEDIPDQVSHFPFMAGRSGRNWEFDKDNFDGAHKLEYNALNANKAAIEESLRALWSSYDPRAQAAAEDESGNPRLKPWSVHLDDPSDLGGRVAGMTPEERAHAWSQEQSDALPFHILMGSKIKEDLGHRSGKFPEGVNPETYARMEQIPHPGAYDWYHLLSNLSHATDVLGEGEGRYLDADGNPAFHLIPQGYLNQLGYKPDRGHMSAFMKTAQQELANTWGTEEARGEHGETWWVFYFWSYG